MSKSAHKLNYVILKGSVDMICRNIQCQHFILASGLKNENQPADYEKPHCQMELSSSGICVMVVTSRKCWCYTTFCACWNIWRTHRGWNIDKCLLILVWWVRFCQQSHINDHRVSWNTGKWHTCFVLLMSADIFKCVWTGDNNHVLCVCVFVIFFKCEPLTLQSTTESDMLWYVRLCQTNIF